MNLIFIVHVAVSVLLMSKFVQCCYNYLKDT